MTFFKMIKAFFVIPRGLYCYELDASVGFFDCDFYSECDDTGEKRLCGNCDFMGREVTDMVKICGIRESKQIKCF